MQLKQLIESHALTLLNPTNATCGVTGLAIDSREVKTGDLFGAISGTQVRGLDFAEAALAAGASCILVEAGDDPEKALALSQKIPVLTCQNIRKVMAHLAAAFYPHQPENCVAITGTNGKSSVVSFLRQLWALLGHKSASLGTLGLEVEGLENPFPKERNSLTTPDTATLHQRLQILKENGVDHVAFEASSHGLDQHRLDGVALRIAAFTNFSQDHLDYHGSLDHYFQSKLRLFKELLDPQGVAVINMKDAKGEEVQKACQARGIEVISVGTQESSIYLEEVKEIGDMQEVTLHIVGDSHTFILPVPGPYQIENIMVVIGILLAQGSTVEDILLACKKLKPIPGRLEPVAPGVYVDYAHTPEALRSSLQAISQKEGNVWVVFGCGGDRDQDKRPLMGQVVAGPEFCGKVIITDDNPRTEDPAQIRQDILQAVPHALNIGDRRRAIQMALSLREPGDKILIAGKGHETYQIIGTEVQDFDDREEVRKAMLLWDSQEAEIATHGTSTAPWQATGVSIDTRTLQPGDLFVALKGEHSDGHAHIGYAFEKGAVAALVSEDVTTKNPLLKVPDTLKALEALGVYARDRASQAKRVAITGSVGKTSTKEILKLALSTQGLTHASASSYNNHWGVPLTLARMHRDTEFAIFEVGMNHPGEITPLTKMIQPHIALITNVAASHLGYFDSIKEIARAKAEIFTGMKAGIAILNGGNEYTQDLAAWAEEANVHEIHTFGLNQGAESWADANTSQVTVLGKSYPTKLPVPGQHLLENSAAVLLAVKLLGADVAEANANLALFAPVSGRGDKHSLIHEGKPFILINESYNANPTSMVAALDVLGQSPQNRKIAVLGDMRELGQHSSSLHKELKTPILQNNVDKVYCCGPYMAELYETLPSALKAGYTESSVDLIPLIKAGLQEGDVVMVKGSLGTRMKPIVEALLAMDDKEQMKVVI